MSEASGAETPTYGEAARRLEEILATIEQGRVDVDALSGLVGEAAGLVQVCRDKIKAAELQVTRITEDLERSTAPAATAAQEPPPTAAQEPPPTAPEAPPNDWVAAAPPVAEDDIPF